MLISFLAGCIIGAVVATAFWGNEIASEQERKGVRG